MKYVEYIYLTGAVMLLIFLATEFRNLPTNTIIALLVATAIFSFMYSFRRVQRKKLEARIEAEMKRLEEDVYGNEEMYEEKR